MLHIPTVLLHTDIRLLKKFTLYEERVETTPGPIDASNRIMVAGIACLENKIYIACCPSNRIIVISGKEPFDRILDEEFEVAGLTNAQDMVACKLTRSLFISDATPSNRTTKIRPKNLPKVYQLFNSDKVGWIS